MRKKTNEEFLKEVYDLVGNEYTFLDKYINAKTKLKVKHNTCNNIYEVVPDKFLRGRRCPKCAIKKRNEAKRKTDEQFKSEVYDLVGDEYSVLGDYKDSNTKIKMNHNVCGYEYEVIPSSFIFGTRCPYCYGVFRKTDEEFKQEVYDLVGNEYSVLGEYINNHTKILMKHNKCERTYEVSPDAFLRGNRCSQCSYKKLSEYRTKTTEQFKQEVYNLVGSDYTVLSDYVSAKTKIKFKHNACGNTYEVRPNGFLRGNRCPWCYQSGSSRGNEYIAKYLDNHNISYEREYKFESCVYKRPLPFDFYLPKLNICIEYDGKQHYIQNGFFEGHDPFRERQLKDEIKSKYCYQNSINLIRIPYTKFDNIDTILNKKLNTK